MSIPKGIRENERFDEFDQENSSIEDFKSIEHTGDQTVLGDEECQGCFVKPELLALYGDKAFPDRKSLRQILKTENDQGSVKVLTKRIIYVCDEETRLGRAAMTNEELAQKLGVPVKNIYNIVSVLLSLGMMERDGRSSFSWMHGANLADVMCYFKSLGEEFQIGAKLESLISPDGVNYCHVKDANNPFANFFSPKTSLIAAACVKLLMLFLSSNREVLPMHLASCAMWKTKDDEKTRCKLKRRIFDLCSILECLNIVKRESTPLNNNVQLPNHVSRCKHTQEQIEDHLFYLKWVYPLRPSQVSSFAFTNIEWELIQDGSFVKKQNWASLRSEFRLGFEVMKRLFITEITSDSKDERASSDNGVELKLPLPCSAFGFACRMEQSKTTAAVVTKKRCIKRKNSNSDQISDRMAKLMKTGLDRVSVEYETSTAPENNSIGFKRSKSNPINMGYTIKDHNMRESSHGDEIYGHGQMDALLPVALTPANSFDSGLESILALNSFSNCCASVAHSISIGQNHIRKIPTLPPISAYMQPLHPDYINVPAYSQHLPMNTSLAYFSPSLNLHQTSAQQQSGIMPAQILNGFVHNASENQALHAWNPDYEFSNRVEAIEVPLGRSLTPRFNAINGSSAGFLTGFTGYQPMPRINESSLDGPHLSTEEFYVSHTVDNQQHVQTQSYADNRSYHPMISPTLDIMNVNSVETERAEFVTESAFWGGTVSQTAVHSYESAMRNTSESLIASNFSGLENVMNDCQNSEGIQSEKLDRQCSSDPSSSIECVLDDILESCHQQSQEEENLSRSQLSDAEFVESESSTSSNEPSDSLYAADTEDY